MYPDQQPEQNLPPTPQQQPLPPLPVQPSLPPQPPVAPYPPAEEPLPGKTLGIIGFIFAFVFLSGIGLVLSIMSLVKAKRAGRKNGLAIAGIVLNIFSTIFVMGIITAITIVSYSGLTARANTVSAETTAASVVKQAEAYYSDNVKYPATYSAISDKMAAGTTQATTILTTEPSNPQTVEFYTCDGLGNKVGYWNYTTGAITYTYAGMATSSDSCSLVTE